MRYKPRDGNFALGFRAPDEFHARVRAHAARRRLNISEFIRTALEEKMSRDESDARPRGLYDTPTASVQSAVQRAPQPNARTLADQMAQIIPSRFTGNQPARKAPVQQPTSTQKLGMHDKPAAVWWSGDKIVRKPT